MLVNPLCPFSTVNIMVPKMIDITITTYTNTMILLVIALKDCLMCDDWFKIVVRSKIANKRSKRNDRSTINTSEPGIKKLRYIGKSESKSTIPYKLNI